MSTPTNNNFENSTSLNGFGEVFIYNDNNTNADIQKYEDSDNYNSIWYAYAPSINGQIIIDGTESSTPIFIKIYLGQDIKYLNLVAAGTVVNINVLEGVQYNIAIVSQYQGSFGPLSFSFTFKNSFKFKFINTDLSIPEFTFSGIRKGLLRQADGRIFALGVYSYLGYFAIAYSDDSGSNWTIDTGAGDTMLYSGYIPSIFFDGYGNLLLLELNDNGVTIHIRDRGLGTWTVSSTINIGSFSGSINSLDADVDSYGNLHIVMSYTDAEFFNDTQVINSSNLYYSRYSTGGDLSLPIKISSYGSIKRLSDNSFIYYSSVEDLFNLPNNNNFSVIIIENIPYVFWVKTSTTYGSTSWGYPLNNFAGPTYYEICSSPIPNIPEWNVIGYNTDTDYSAGDVMLYRINYTLSDVPYYLDQLFLCTTNYTSGASFQVDIVAGYWQYISTSIDPQEVGTGELSDIMGGVGQYFNNGYNILVNCSSLGNLLVSSYASDPNIIDSTYIEDRTLYNGFYGYDQREAFYTVIKSAYDGINIHNYYNFVKTIGSLEGPYTILQSAIYTIGGYSQGDVNDNSLTFFLDMQTIYYFQTNANGDVNLFGISYGTSNYSLIKSLVQGSWGDVSQIDELSFGGYTTFLTNIPDGSLSSFMVAGEGE